MIPIPINETIIHQLCGRPICIFTQNGYRYIGKLSSCQQGKIILNDRPTSMHVPNTSAAFVKALSKKRKSKEKWNKKSLAGSENRKEAQINTFGPFSPFPFFPYNGRIELDLAFVALLFLLFI